MMNCSNINNNSSNNMIKINLNNNNMISTSILQPQSIVTTNSLLSGNTNINNNKVKARVLFDFEAADESELSVTANEVSSLIIYLIIKLRIFILSLYSLKLYQMLMIG